ncbi:tRNA preQ1(34) S-adenosylmethionine ribosyltransferase-isomerase QueA [cf. Phormidesmis sp. LEGE 11477]|uniref:tRNA preQ1(34) S-adenosylmethionine ribosyltransferase-isomerase QueA n=1 Tax=cf. Phormidesmis sp. LEGE 11477 TaxID=1828680 RepID=UPI001882C1CE|nr:tRNA preQ1(34) S-adenosylmethionine ribosyltransferase-isomerase QueA [cf. Phormidesmis sp. LEGE 11477]MBE9060126.1 tRNA preQ1(34) S-adenosylmethionine ribosyltransferase-isomerase QueA [cf. Phormidesmis sp. LEGE 11477]
MTNIPPGDRLSSSPDHQLNAYSYNLPEGRIAQNPVTPRDSSKLLVIDGPQSHHHNHFYDLVDWLLPGDLLVLNDTKVIPARLYGYKASGGAVEVLLIEPVEHDKWLALVRPGRRIQPGTEILFGEKDHPLMSALVESRDDSTGGRLLRLLPKVDKTIDALIHQLGQMPLPPYITESASLPEQYQTVFAQKKGAIAAPTAGLHFTQTLLDKLSSKGIQTAEITLHVGIGTFRPVEVSDIKTHEMHKERIEVSAETVKKIEQTKAKGKRVITVGTTSTRALEGVAAICGGLQPYSGKTDLFIYPGYRWQVIDGLITNFHLPGSSLLMMVSTLIGRERLMAIYQDAIAHDYRFYSFGDAMLVLPEAKI